MASADPQRHVDGRSQATLLEYGLSMQATLDEVRRVVAMDPASEWSIISDSRQAVDLGCGAGVEYVESLFQNTSETLSLPNEWLIGDEYTEVFNRMCNILGSLTQSIDVLDPAEELRYSLDLNVGTPDFFESHIQNEGWNHPDASVLTSERSCQQVLNVLLYDGLEDLASAYLSSLYSNIPGCQLVLRAYMEFPWARRGLGTPTPVDFALVNDPFSFSHRKCSSEPISMRNPINVPLLVGLKAGKPWNMALASRRRLRQETTMEQQLRKMAMQFEPTFQSMLMVWKLRTRDPTDIPINPSERTLKRPPLPFWSVVFGLIYDSERLLLVAYVPFQKPRTPEQDGCCYSCVMYVVRTYPFAAYSSPCPDLETVIMDRLRLALDLCMLRKHCFRLTTLFDGIVWPSAVQDDFDPAPSRPPGSSTASDTMDWVPKGDEDFWDDTMYEDPAFLLSVFWHSHRPVEVREWVEAVRQNGSGVDL